MPSECYYGSLCSLSFLYPPHKKKDQREKLGMESEKEQREERRKTPEQAQRDQRLYESTVTSENIALLCGQRCRVAL